MQEQWTVEQLVRILEESLTLKTKEGRDDIISGLSADIRNNIQRREQTRGDVYQIVLTCGHYDGGIEQLIAQLEKQEGQSIAVKRTKSLIAPLPSPNPDETEEEPASIPVNRAKVLKQRAKRIARVPKPEQSKEGFAPKQLSDSDKKEEVKEASISVNPPEEVIVSP